MKVVELDVNTEEPEVKKDNKKEVEKLDQRVEVIEVRMNKEVQNLKTGKV